MLIRIYTEDKNSEGITDLCNKYLTGYTMYRGMGVWKGTREPALIVELIDQDELRGSNLMMKLARDIKKMNEQEAVLILKSQSSEEFV